LDSDLGIAFAKKYEFNKTGSGYSDSYRKPLYDFKKVVDGFIYGHYANGDRDITQYTVSESSSELYYNSSSIAQWRTITWNGSFIDFSGYGNHHNIIPCKKVGDYSFGYRLYKFAEGDYLDHRMVAVINSNTPLFVFKYRGTYLISETQNPESHYQKYFLPFDVIQNASILPESQVAVSFPTYNLKALSIKVSSGVGIRLFYDPINKNHKKCNVTFADKVSVRKVSNSYVGTSSSWSLTHYTKGGYQYYSYDLSPYPSTNEITSSYTITDKPSLSFSSCPLTKRTITPNTELQPFGDDSCILYYKFNGNLKDEFNNFNAVASYNIEFTKYQGIDCVHLKGMDSYIKFNRPTSSSNQRFTITFLVSTISYYGDSHPTTQVQVMGCRYKYGSGNKKDFILQVKNGNYGKARTYYGNGSGITYDSNYVLSDGLWHRVAIVFNGSKLKFYIDGNMISSYNATEITDQVSFWYIGKVLDEFGSSYPSSMVGYVAHFRVFNRALSESEIGQLFTEEYVK